MHGTRRRVARKRAPPRSAAKKSDLTVSLSPFLVDGSDLAFREFIADLFAAASTMQALRRALAHSIRLSAAEFSILLATWCLQKQGKASISAIARHLHIASAHVTAEVGKLVDSSHLRKSPDRSDSRAVVVTLTKRGEAILIELTPLLRRINTRLFSGIAPSEVAVISRFLKQIVAEAPQSTRMVRASSP
jgi:DNA-binding MarR family transcriptional regulator